MLRWVLEIEFAYIMFWCLDLHKVFKLIINKQRTACVFFLRNLSLDVFFLGLEVTHTCQVKDLKIHSEIPLRAINLLKFSFGGHLLAATQGKVIHIFSVRTLTKVGPLGELKGLGCFLKRSS